MYYYDEDYDYGYDALNEMLEEAYLDGYSQAIYENSFEDQYKMMKLKDRENRRRSGAAFDLKYGEKRKMTNKGMAMAKGAGRGALIGGVIGAIHGHKSGFGAAKGAKAGAVLGGIGGAAVGGHYANIKNHINSRFNKNRERKLALYNTAHGLD